MPGLPSLAPKGRLAIIAGNGFLPTYLAEAARGGGENPFIISLRNESDQRFDDFEAATASIADIKSFERIFKEKGIDRVVLSGGVTRRPDWRDIRPNWKVLRKLPLLLRTLVSGGDDALLQVAIGIIEAQGCRVIGAHEVAPGLLARTGRLGAHAPSQDDIRDIEKAAEAARRLGELDIGQGGVSVGGRVVALEGVEGTDRMLERVTALRAEGRISARRKGVLVKLCKPQQDMRADLPTIGPSTVENAVKAGLAGIAVEAGRALVLEEQKMVAAADAAGIFVCGIDLGLPQGGL
ncbi:LpxI family protein [Neorhizobium alkalisoli]|uniref:LpxI family protein n=1 Tax=Neorhizobium alkalisoli TaxID=528178 RepID=UPI000CFA04B7|nr:UDP-2,3-diacylglucosamine diphosphatase LpxI [Neorhizobium alkalisoli]